MTTSILHTNRQMKISPGTQNGRMSKPSAGTPAYLYAMTRFLKIPWWLVYYIVASNRPHPEWSYTNAVGAKLYTIAFDFLTDVHLSGSRSLEPGGQGNLFQLLEPPPNDAFQGPIKSSIICPGPVPGIWCKRPPKLPLIEGQKLILHFHGGAYVSLSARLAGNRRGPGYIVEKLDSAYALCVDYRKASDLGYSHFPAQLQDAITAYYSALALVVSPNNLYLCGDSAGAHLTISLIRYLERYKTFPLPRAALIHSPWLDLTADGVNVVGKTNYGIDFVNSRWITWGAESFIPPGMDRTNEWISPGLHPFKTSVPIWVQIGTAEVLYPGLLKYAKAMKEKGTSIEVYEVPNAPHDCFCSAPEFGMEKEEDEAITQAVKWVNEL